MYIYNEIKIKSQISFPVKKTNYTCMGKLKYL